MEHAAQAVAAIALAMAGPAPRVAVLCGPGNNGGDGYGAARFLAAWGARPRVLRLAPSVPRGADAAREAAWCAASVPPEDAWARPALLAEAAAEAQLVVDAVFGIGPARVEGPFPAWFETLNRGRTPVLAVDVPSGLDADTGLPCPVAVRADVTVTMAAPKVGLVAPSPGAAWAG